METQNIVIEDSIFDEIVMYALTEEHFGSLSNLAFGFSVHLKARCASEAKELCLLEVANNILVHITKLTAVTLVNNEDNLLILICAHNLRILRTLNCICHLLHRGDDSLRDLKSREDWNEWQANVLGAAILMPQKEIDLAMWYFAGGKTLINYEGRFSYRDRLSLNLICHQLGVSKTAAIIRLRDLGYIEDRPYLEFVDPLEVWA